MLKDIKFKIKLQYWFLTLKYESIESAIINDPSIISDLTNKEIQALYYYVKKENQSQQFKHNKLLYFLMYYSFSVFDQEQRQDIIDLLYNKNHGRYVPYFDSMIDYFDDFYTVGIQHENIFILERLAYIVDKNPEAYKYEINRINDVFLKANVDSPTVEVANLKAFASPQLDDKILNSEIRYIIKHIKKNQETKKGVELVTKLLALNPKIEDIKALAQEAKILGVLSELTNIIREQTSDLVLKSKYLYALYELDSKEEIILDILALNDFLTILNLMNTLSEEQQEKYAMKALDEQNDPLIYTLACTTKCTGTYQLIEYVLNTSNIRKNAFLVSSLSGEYLSNTLSNILNTLGAEYYMGILNYLYTFSLSNLIEAIDFIFATNNTFLFKEEDLSNLMNIKQSFTLNESILQ